MSKLSLMPEGLQQGLTLEQFADLIAFLESRKTDPRSSRIEPSPAGFIHLPQSAAMVATSGLDQPSMDLPLMIRAIETALRVTASSLSSAR